MGRQLDVFAWAACLRAKQRDLVIIREVSAAKGEDIHSRQHGSGEAFDESSSEEERPGIRRLENSDLRRLGAFNLRKPWEVLEPRLQLSAPRANSKLEA